MRQVMRKGLITVAAASGALAVTGGIAYADAGATGTASDSPGVASGNSVQAPVHVPVNVCGNTIDVIGLLNPAAGNSCANTSDASDDDGSGDDSYGGSSSSGGGSHAGGHTSDSPGVGSGNNVQLPIDLPVNACGNTVDVIGIGNPAGGNDCANGESTPPPVTPPTEPPVTPHHPGTPEKPPVTPRTPDQPNKPGTQTVTPPKGQSQLAETGSSLPIGAAGAASAGALLAGAVLYRRAKAGV
ncbi:MULTISPECIES: chaplin [Streptomyces]|uniref:Chaplin n=1 Tax=Streptomyces xanthii TaxID=2768069 RepID=A0A7H1BEL6_9ACTN|nr:chaplin [Streptomyces xanthii]QNS07171.1 chaplin [Streptomyces xanthii]